MGSHPADIGDMGEVPTWSSYMEFFVSRILTEWRRDVDWAISGQRPSSWTSLCSLVDRSLESPPTTEEEARAFLGLLEQETREFADDPSAPAFLARFLRVDASRRFPEWWPRPLRDEEVQQVGEEALALARSSHVVEDVDAACRAIHWAFPDDDQLAWSSRKEWARVARQSSRIEVLSSVCRELASCSADWQSVPEGVDAHRFLLGNADLFRSYAARVGHVHIFESIFWEGLLLLSGERSMDLLSAVVDNLASVARSCEPSLGSTETESSDYVGQLILLALSAVFAMDDTQQLRGLATAIIDHHGSGALQDPGLFREVSLIQQSIEVVDSFDDHSHLAQSDLDVVVDLLDEGRRYSAAYLVIGYFRATHHRRRWLSEHEVTALRLVYDSIDANRDFLLAATMYPVIDAYLAEVTRGHPIPVQASDTLSVLNDISVGLITKYRARESVLSRIGA